MAEAKKGIQGIRTMGALLDHRRARTPAGALLELSAMANEKMLLTKELDRWTRRHAEIEARLAEIAAKERRLLAYVQDPSAVGVAQGASRAAGASAAAARGPAAAAPEIPVAPQGFKVKEFQY